MKQVESFRWLMPPKVWDGPRAKPYLSAWSMTAEEATERGAIRPDPTTRAVVLVPETPEEEAQLRRAGDTSRLGGPAPGSIGDQRGKR